jgi:hypothetical protein
MKLEGGATIKQIAALLCLLAAIQNSHTDKRHGL